MAKEDNYGRSSWDETAVLVAVKGYKPYYILQRGTIIVNKDGSNTWANKGKGQYYLVEKQSHKQVEELINNLIQHLPSDR
jgi:predicted lipoprotein with Yx(FWY)xxD motif